jgi:hypothetical protein
VDAVSPCRNADGRANTKKCVLLTGQFTKTGSKKCLKNGYHQKFIKMSLKTEM